MRVYEERAHDIEDGVTAVSYAENVVSLGCLAGYGLKKLLALTSHYEPHERRCFRAILRLPASSIR